MSLRFRAGTATLALVVLWTVVVPAPSFPSAAVSVISEAGEELLSATVRETSLRGLLTEVATQAGFQLTGLSSTERMISVACSRVPLDQALTQILQREGFSFLLVYNRSGTRRLKRLIVLGASTQSPSLSGGGGEITPVSEEPERIVPEDADAFDPDAPLEQLLGWTAHRDARMRTAALEALSQHPTDERARHALLGGLQDADSTVRSTALGLLGSLMAQWPGAEEGAMLALSDRAPAVRQLALLTLWEASSPRVPDALSIVLRDPDPGIRAQAEEFIRAAEAAAGATTE